MSGGNHNNQQGVRLAMEAAREHEGKSDISLNVSLDEHEYTLVISALQLALRNPKFRQLPSAGVVQRFVEKLIFMCPEDRPVLRRLLELGNQSYD